jgi:anti-anti-sigma factor
MTDMGTLRRYRPDPSRIGQTETWRRASASAEVSPESIVVTIAGELDASNAQDFAGYVERHSAATRRLYLDLREVTFISTAGLAVLRRVEYQYAQRGSRWWLLASPAVRKLLRVCDAQDLPQLETLRRRSALPEMV